MVLTELVGEDDNAALCMIPSHCDCNRRLGTHAKAGDGKDGSTRELNRSRLRRQDGGVLWELSVWCLQA